MSAFRLTTAALAAVAALASVSDAAPAARAAIPSFKASSIKSFVLTSWGPMESLNTKGDVVILDGNLQSAETIKKQKAQGKKVVCYISAGTVENWRADAKDAKSEMTMGKKYKGFGGTETWINIMDWQSAKPIMSQRIAEAASKGCDGLEADNVDCYVAGSACVAGASYEQLKKKQIEYVKWLASQVHSKGMAFGMKNSIEIIPDVVGSMDFAINEQCQQYKNGQGVAECAGYEAFRKANKAVFGVEYSPKSDVCAQAKKFGMLTKYRSGGSYKNCF